MSLNNPTIEDMMQQVASYKAGVTDASAQSQDLDATRSGLAQANAMLAPVIGQDNATITAAKTASDLQFQSQNQNAVTAFGTDISDQSSVVRQLGATTQQALSDKLDALQTINQKKSVNFLDDPMQWVSNQFTINSDVDKYNAANSLYNTSTQAVAELNQLTQAQILTNKANAAPMTTASAAASADINVQEAQAKANDAQSAAAGYSLDGVSQAMKYSKDQIEANFSAQQLKQSVINTELARQRLTQETLEWPMRVKMMQDQLDNIDGQKAVGTSVINDINAGIHAAGDKRPPLTDNEGKTVLYMLKNKTPLSNEWNTYMQMGQQTGMTADASGSTTPVLGLTPAKLYGNLSAIPTNLDPHLSYGMDVASQAAQTVAAAADNPNKAQLLPYLQNVTRKDPSSISTAINTTAALTMANFATEIKPTDPKNPYNFGDINSISNLPAVQNTDIYQKVFAAPVASGVTIPQDKAVEMAYQAFKDKTITSTEYQQLSTVLSAGIAVNNQSRNFAGMGYTPQTTNNLRMPTGSTNMWGTPETAVTNFADPTAALTAANKRMARELSATLVNSGY